MLLPAWAPKPRVELPANVVTVAGVSRLQVVATVLPMGNMASTEVDRVQVERAPLPVVVDVDVSAPLPPAFDTTVP